MLNLFRIAIRNLMRYKRRTFLTASLITIGVLFVLVFIETDSPLLLVVLDITLATAKTPEDYDPNTEITVSNLFFAGMGKQNFPWHMKM